MALDRRQRNAVVAKTYAEWAAEQSVSPDKRYSTNDPSQYAETMEALSAEPDAAQDLLDRTNAALAQAEKDATDADDPFLDTETALSLTAAGGTSQAWRDQLRIPKGNGKASGRWTFTPWKHLDDLAGLLNSLGPGQYPETRAGVQSALDTLKGFDANNFDVHDADLITASATVADLLASTPDSGDPSFDAALADARAGIAQFAETDWSLFDEASDLDVPVGGRVTNGGVWDGPVPSDAPVAPEMADRSSQWLVDELARIKAHPVAPSPSARRKRAAYLKELNDRRDRDEGVDVVTPEDTDLTREQDTDIDKPEPAPAPAPAPEPDGPMHVEPQLDTKTGNVYVRDAMGRRVFLGTVRKESVGNPSARGGAYKTVWVPYVIYSEHGERWKLPKNASYDTRKEALDALLQSRDSQGRLRRKGLTLDAPAPTVAPEPERDSPEYDRQRTIDQSQMSAEEFVQKYGVHGQGGWFLSGDRVQTEQGPGTVSAISTRGMNIDLDEPRGDSLHIVTGTPGFDRLKKVDPHALPTNNDAIKLLAPLHDLAFDGLRDAQDTDGLTGSLQILRALHDRSVELGVGVDGDFGTAIAEAMDAIRQNDTDEFDLIMRFLQKRLDPKRYAGPAVDQTWVMYQQVFTEENRAKWRGWLDANKTDVHSDLTARYGEIPVERRDPLAVIKDIGQFYATRRVNNNCVLASTAYELRRRGIDAHPKQAKDGRGATFAQQTWFWTDHTAYSRVDGLKGRQVAMRYKIVHDHVRNLHPPGARGTISAGWKNRSYGHIWNWEVDENSQVTFFDPQTGKVVGKDAEDYWREIDHNNVSISRLDNKPLRTHVEVILAPREHVDQINDLGAVGTIAADLKANVTKAINKVDRVDKNRPVLGAPGYAAWRTRYDEAYDEYRTAMTAASHYRGSADFKRLSEVGNAVPFLDPSKNRM